MDRPPASLPGWLLAELAPTLRLATALTGSAPAAAELVAYALATDSTWTGLETRADPQPVLRGLVARRHLAGHADRRRRQRAAIALCEGERLTLGEAATVLDRPVRQLAADLADHDAPALRAELARLRGAAPPVATVVDRYATVVRMLTRRRRRRVLAGTIVGTAAAAAALALLPTLAVPPEPPRLRSAGEWRFSHTVAAVDGMQQTQRIVTRRTELTILRSPAAGHGLAQCTVRITVGVGSPAPTDAHRPGRAIRVNGRAATYHDPPADDPVIVWDGTAGGLASLTCTRTVPRSRMLAVAEAVQFEDSRVRLPFTFSPALPSDYAVYGLTETVGGGVAVTLQPNASITIPSVEVRSGPARGSHRCLGEVAGPGADQSRLVCLSTAWSPEEAPEAPGIVRRSLDRVASTVQAAADPGDRLTWFDAAELPD